MKVFFKIFLLIAALASGSCFFSRAAMAELILCEQGVDFCKAFEKKDDKKYSECMKTSCSAFYNPDEKNKTGDAYFFKLQYFQNEVERVGEGEMKTCDYGIRKCDVLSYSSTYYWRCMKAECGPRYDHDADANCSPGLSFCQPKLSEYRNCVNTTCNLKSGEFDECDESRKVCKSTLKDYYHCLYGICLGPVNHYAYFADVKKFAIVEDNIGIKKRVEVKKHKIIQEGVPTEEQQAPPGVDPKEWISDIPNDRRIVQNPIVRYRCIFPDAEMACETSDIASCHCTDGFKPVEVEKYYNMFDSLEEIKFFEEVNNRLEQALEVEFRKRGYYDQLDKKYGVKRN